MKQLNLNNVDWNKTLLYGVIILLSVLLFFKWTETDDLKMVNSLLKKEAAQSEKNAQQYVDANNVLHDSIKKLESKKQEVKKEIIVVKEKTKAKLEIVSSLTSKGIAVYYNNRYHTSVVITQYGVALPDSIAKINIAETVERDSFIEELNLTKEQLAIEEEKGIVKDSINKNLSLANDEWKNANFVQKEIIKNTESSFKSEKRKKTFWQITTAAVTTAAAYLLIKN